jgi:uncharacterized protein (TIGR02757 family)
MKVAHPLSISKLQLDRLYRAYNSREWVHPDPLECLYQYRDPLDQEIAGLIASCLAYGRVAQILKSVQWVLDKMGPSPYQFLQCMTRGSLQKDFGDFKHRFTTSQELIALFIGVKRVMACYGSLHACFLYGLKADDEDVLPALSRMVRELTTGFNGRCNSLLPLPERGSACKRLNLFLRWMVRKDHVDPGGWPDVPAAKLIVPLDTHMYRICSSLKLTSRKNADMCTAMEITRAFRCLQPRDPVRYDFALTRLGIRKDADPNVLLTNCDPPALGLNAL